MPLRWWVQGTMLVASFWLALVVALPATAAWGITAVMLVGMAAFYLVYGGVRVVVRDGWFHAGRARIEVTLLGEATALDAAETRRVAGVDADARAHLVLRPYLKGAVRVELTDPADPTPYWLVSTRHPAALATALSGATARLATGRTHQED